MNQYEEIPILSEKTIDKSGRTRNEEFVLDSEMNKFIKLLNSSLKKKDRDKIEFTSSDMSGNTLSLTHELEIKHVSVLLYDNNDVIVLPANYVYLATGVGTGNLTIYQPVTGIWIVYVKY